MPIRQYARRFLIVYLISALLSISFNAAWAGAADFTSDDASNNASNTNSSIIPTKCPALTDCFPNAEAAKQAREKYAKANNCYFLEDVCENHVKNDKNGAQAEDQGFWGGLWSDIKAGVKYGYDFTKGLFAGLKDQISDIVELITNPLEVAQGLAALAQAFYDDFQGTLNILGELLGEEVAKTIARATECGPYDLGKVIGENISPAVMLKLATKLAKYSGKLSGAVKAVKKDIGCASFIAGTLVLTPQTSTAIEQIKVGDLVESRHEQTWQDKSQGVTKTFSRIAPSYRAVKTEKETFYLTDEHPLWVQGQGWTEAKDIKVDDVLSAKGDDLSVLENLLINQEVKVYNFSVDKTPSYFVGYSQLWAHNSKCSIWSSDPKERGRLIEDYLTVTEYKAWQKTDNFINPKTGKPFKSNNFPLIDFQKGNVVVSLKTVDTKGGSWKNRMKNHIDDLKKTDIKVDGKSATKELDIRVQPGGLKDAESLIKYGQKQGIKVTVKEVDL